MSWIHPLFNAAALALSKPGEWQNQHAFENRFQEALKVVDLYNKKPALDKADQKNLGELGATLAAVLTHFITHFPLASAEKFPFDTIHAFIQHAAFSQAQKKKLGSLFKNKAEDILAKEPGRAYESLLGGRNGLSESPLRATVVALVLKHVDAVAKKSPTLAVKMAVTALHRSKQGSREETRLIDAIKRHAPLYAERYEEAGESVENDFASILIYSKNPRRIKMAEEVWVHYMRRLSQREASQPPKQGDPPGILTLPSESDDFRLQAYTAISELATIAAHNNGVHAMRTARISFQDNFDYLAEIDPKGASRFACHMISEISWLERETHRYPELVAEALLLTEAVYAKFISTGLLENTPVIEMRMSSHNLQMAAAKRTHDGEKRCFALEAALRRAQNLTTAGKPMEAAEYAVKIAQSIIKQNTPPEYEGQRPVIIETEAQAARRKAVKQQALEQALTSLKKINGIAENGSPLALTLAALAGRGSRIQTGALDVALSFAKRLIGSRPLVAREQLETFIKTAGELKKPVLVTEAREAFRTVGTPTPFTPEERGALKIFLDSRPA